MRKARTARPTGQKKMKPRIITAIKAGLPISSSLAAIPTFLLLDVNVTYIHIVEP
jgi:hypothetical protein